MKRFAHIMITSVMLLLLLLAGSGVTLVKCACTGNVKLAVPIEDGCCSDHDCMTVRVTSVQPETDDVPTFHSSTSSNLIADLSKKTELYIPSITVDKSSPQHKKCMPNGNGERYFVLRV